MGTQSADTSVESHTRNAGIDEHSQTGQERQNGPLDAGREETDQRWNTVEQWTRDTIVRFERGTAPTKGRVLGGLLAGLVGLVSFAIGLGLFVIVLPMLLLETRYPTRWGGRLTRIPVMLTAVGVASLGHVATCLRGSHDSSTRAVAHMGDGARSTQGARGNRWQPGPGTTDAGSREKSVLEVGREWGCIECRTTVYGVGRPRTCPRCARNEYDLPTGVDLFTLNQPVRSDSTAIRPDSLTRSADEDRTPEQT